ALDKSGNEGFYPEDGFLNVAIIGTSPLDYFESDFDTPPDNVGGNFFSIIQPAGFANKAVHSAHPYQASIGPDVATSTFTWMITKPIKVSATSPFIQFDEIVITEYQGENPVDYVVMEASKDGGATWESLIPKHAANYFDDWKTVYDQAGTPGPNTFITRN